MSDGFAALFWGVLTFSLLIVIHEGGHFLAARAVRREGSRVHDRPAGPGAALPRQEDHLRHHRDPARRLRAHRRHGARTRGPAARARTRCSDAHAAPRTPRDLATDLGIEEADADRLLITLADWDALRCRSRATSTPTASRFAAERCRRPRRAARPRAQRDLPRSADLQAHRRASAGVVLNLSPRSSSSPCVVSAFGVLTTQGLARSPRSRPPRRPGSQRATGSPSVDGEAHRTRGSELARRSRRNEAGRRRDRRRSSATAQSDDGDRRSSARTRRPARGAARRVAEHREADACGEAILESFSYIGLTFQAILQFFNPETFAARRSSQSSSIIGASYMAADAARTSALNYAAIVALLSLSLGVINIFPIPPLDGGKVAVEIVERFRGRPLSRRIVARRSRRPARCCSSPHRLPHVL